MNTCTNCGTPNMPMAKFCKSCGTPNSALGNSAPLSPQQGYGNSAPLPPNQHGYSNSAPLPTSFQTGQLNTPYTQNLPSQQQMVSYQPVQQAPVYIQQQGTSDVGKLMMFEANKKSAGVAILLCFFFGTLGVHRFYLGQSGTGAAMLCITITSWLLMFVLVGFVTIWISVIWAFIDLFLISGMTSNYNNQLAARMNIYH